MPSALARFSSCFQTGAGNRIDFGMVGPVSSPFRGRPRPTWTIPSAAIRSAYGLGRTLADAKSTSGISRRDARLGSRCLRAFFIVPSLMRRRAACADDPDLVLIDVRVDRQKNSLPLGHADEHR